MTVLGDALTLDKLLSLLRAPAARDVPVSTAGQLADAIERAYRAAHFRPAPPPPSAPPARRILW